MSKLAQTAIEGIIFLNALPNSARTRLVVSVDIKIRRIVQPPQTWRPTRSVALEPMQLMQLSINLPVVLWMAQYSRHSPDLVKPQCRLAIVHIRLTKQGMYLFLVQGIFLIIHLHLGPTSLGGVPRVTGQCILSKIVNFSSWWGQAAPAHPFQPQWLWDMTYYFRLRSAVSESIKFLRYIWLSI